MSFVCPTQRNTVSLDVTFAETVCHPACTWFDATRALPRPPSESESPAGLSELWTSRGQARAAKRRSLCLRLKQDQWNCLLLRHTQRTECRRVQFGVPQAGKSRDANATLPAGHADCRPEPFTALLSARRGGAERRHGDHVERAKRTRCATVPGTVPRLRTVQPLLLRAAVWHGHGCHVTELQILAWSAGPPACVLPGCRSAMRRPCTGCRNKVRRLAAFTSPASSSSHECVAGEHARMSHVYSS
jgi:hypothetical protein